MIKCYDKVVYKKPSEIKPYAENARINEAAISALVKAIPVMGFNVPLVLDKNGVIVKGHSRFEACKRLNFDLIPCIIIDGTEEAIAEERLLDNRLSELAEWDNSKLEYELKELPIDLTKFEISVPVIKSDVFQVRDVKPEDVKKTAAQITGDGLKTKAEKQSLIELHCPKCGKDFFVDLEEVIRYAE